MNDRRTILALIAMGRITPLQAERLLAAVNESRETVWIFGLCLAAVCLKQVDLRELFLGLVHLFNAHLPALAQALHHALWPMNEFLGGSL